MPGARPTHYILFFEKYNLINKENVYVGSLNI